MAAMVTKMLAKRGRREEVLFCMVLTGRVSIVADADARLGAVAVKLGIIVQIQWCEVVGDNSRNNTKFCLS